MLSATRAARAVRAGEVSPVELVEDALDRLGRWQPVINAFSQVRPDAAIEEARVRSTAVARREELGPLHGVPVAVKDLFDVTGWETTGCCNAYRGNVATRDAAAVRRLRAAGAIIVGKTNQHELAAGGTNVVSACGPTRNPWDPSRMTGGSSGGSAAAVAARVVPLALGTDTGGSVRIPASLCGISGLKPTFGRVSTSGVMPLSPSLDTVGPLAVDMADVALAYSILADESPAFGEEAVGSVNGIRVGIEQGFFSERIRPEVMEGLDDLRASLEAAGAVSVPVDVGSMGDHGETWARVAWAEFAAAHGHLLRRPESLYGRTRDALEVGSREPAVDFIRARVRMEEVRRSFERALRQCDVILAPATPFPAPALDAETVTVGDDRHDVHRGGTSWFTRPVNLAGLPALSVPSGFFRGIPLGAQLIGRRRGEGVLLRIGRALQASTEHHEPAPRPPSGALGTRP